MWCGNGGSLSQGAQEISSIQRIWSFLSGSREPQGGISLLLSHGSHQDPPRAANLPAWTHHLLPWSHPLSPPILSHHPWCYPVIPSYIPSSLCSPLSALISSLFVPFYPFPPHPLSHYPVFIPFPSALSHWPCFSRYGWSPGTGGAILCPAAKPVPSDDPQKAPGAEQTAAALR